MPTGRYSASKRFFDITNQEVYLGKPAKLVFTNDPNNIFYEIRANDTLHSIAAQVYAPLARPPEFSAADLAYVIADYQPEYGLQIHDLYMILPIGTRLVLPSVSAVASLVKGF